MRLENNGYLVKGLYRKKWSSTIENYRGVGSYVSWPLKYLNDKTSRRLSREAERKYFRYNDIFSFVPNRDLLTRYVEHCKSNNIEIEILQVETIKKSDFEVDKLKLVEVLGYDCIISDDTSCLDMHPTGFTNLDNYLLKLNSNHLFDLIEEAKEFVLIYNKYVLDGKNLEHGEDLIISLLSIVEL